MKNATDSKQDLYRVLDIDIRNPQPCKVVMDRLFRGDRNALSTCLQPNHNKLQIKLQHVGATSNEVA